MQSKAGSTKSSFINNKNTVEILKDFGYNTSNEFNPYKKESSKPTYQPRKEFSLFNYSEYYEKEIVKKEINKLMEQVRQEIEYIKKADKSLLNEIKDIEKIALEPMPDKSGIYHIHFLEIVIRILQAVRAKIGESKTWLKALVSKKKKRGSLFVVRSKKAGTQYSLSQELQSARSIQ